MVPKHGFVHSLNMRLMTWSACTARGGRSSAARRVGSLAQGELKVGMPGNGHLFSAVLSAIAFSSFSSCSLCRQMSQIFLGMVPSGRLGK